MATRFEIVLAGDDPVALRAIGEEALREIAECEDRISPFRPGSSIARANRDAASRPVRVDPLTFELLQACAELWRATDGAFDPTIGSLMRALGFRDDPAGSADEIAAARAAVGMDGVVLDPSHRTVRFARPGVALDVGAIGKGHALDLAAEVLHEHGIERALLHGGTSTVVAVGAPPGTPGWRVALGPSHDAPSVELRDEALSVSAAHGRRAPDGAPHVLDPRSGQPVRPDAPYAAIVAPTARAADAWSTAMLVRGPTAPPPAPLRCTMPGPSRPLTDP